jgi:hypothetical protein
LIWCGTPPTSALRLARRSAGGSRAALRRQETVYSGLGPARTWCFSPTGIAQRGSRPARRQRSGSACPGSAHGMTAGMSTSQPESFLRGYGIEPGGAVLPRQNGLVAGQAGSTVEMLPAPSMPPWPARWAAQVHRRTN